MLSIFKLVLTILLLTAVAGLIPILGSKARTQNLLIGATVFCSVMFATFVWGVGILAN